MTMDAKTQGEWEGVYSSETFMHKNEYPSLEIVSFLMKRYGRLTDRSQISVLDLGCGWGNNLKFLKEKGFNYFGVDFSESAVKHCLENHKNISCCSLEDLPFESNSMDVIFDRMAIQHNEPKVIEKIFAEVHRVLKKDGVFYSILVDKADYDFYTTFLSVKEIKDLSQKFDRIELDYQETSMNNGKNIYRANILTAYK